MNAVKILKRAMLLGCLLLLFAPSPCIQTAKAEAPENMEFFFKFLLAQTPAYKKYQAYLDSPKHKAWSTSSNPEDRADDAKWIYDYEQMLERDAEKLANKIAELQEKNPKKIKDLMYYVLLIKEVSGEENAPAQTPSPQPPAANLPSGPSLSSKYGPLDTINFAAIMKEYQKILNDCKASNKNPNSFRDFKLFDTAVKNPNELRYGHRLELAKRFPRAGGTPEGASPKAGANREYAAPGTNVAPPEYAAPTASGFAEDGLADRLLDGSVPPDSPEVKSAVQDYVKDTKSAAGGGDPKFQAQIDTLAGKMTKGNIQSSK